MSEESADYAPKKTTGHLIEELLETQTKEVASYAKQQGKVTLLRLMIFFGKKWQQWINALISHWNMKGSCLRPPRGFWCKCRVTQLTRSEGEKIADKPPNAANMDVSSPR